MNPLTELLTGHDRWNGAACTGEWDLFDPRDEDEPVEAFTARIELARAICGACPLLADCHDTAQNMTRRDRVGVWAGVAYDSQGRPTRNRKDPK